MNVDVKLSRSSSLWASEQTWDSSKRACSSLTWHTYLFLHILYTLVIHFIPREFSLDLPLILCISWCSYFGCSHLFSWLLGQHTLAVGNLQPVGLIKPGMSPNLVFEAFIHKTHPLASHLMQLVVSGVRQVWIWLQRNKWGLRSWSFFWKWCSLPVPIDSYWQGVPFRLAVLGSSLTKIV